MKQRISNLVIAGTLLTSLLAAASAGASSKDEAPAFSACSNVKLVSTDQEKSSYQASHPHCLAEVDPVLGSSNLSILMDGMNATTSDNVKYLWQGMLQEQYRKDLNSKLAYWKDVAACLGSTGCTRHDVIKSTYGKVIHQLRMDLALANIADNNGTPELKSFSNAAIKKVKDKLPNLFPPAVKGELTAQEVQEVKAATSKGDLAQIQERARAAYLKDLMGAVNNGEYLVALLPKPSTDDGQAEWSPKQWRKVMGELSSHAEAEKANIDKIVNEDPADLPNPPFTADDFLRLHYEMDKYLSQPGNTAFCGIAQAAESWMNQKQKMDTYAMYASFALSGGAIGADAVLAKDAAESAGARLAMLGSTALGAAGGAWGVALTANELNEAHQNGSETFKDIAKVGVEQGKEVDTQSVKAVEAALSSSQNATWKKAMWGNAKFAALTMVGVGGLGLGARAIVKGMVRDAEGKQAIANLILMSEDPDKVIQTLKTMPGKAAQKEALLANIKEADDAIYAQKVLKDQFSTLKKQMKPAEVDEVSGLVNQLIEKEKTEDMVKQGCEGMSDSACLQLARESAVKKVRAQVKQSMVACGVR